MTVWQRRRGGERQDECPGPRPLPPSPRRRLRAAAAWGALLGAAEFLNNGGLPVPDMLSTKAKAVEKEEKARIKALQGQADEIKASIKRAKKEAKKRIALAKKADKEAKKAAKRKAKQEAKMKRRESKDGKKSEGAKPEKAGPSGEDRHVERPAGDGCCGAPPP